MGNTGSVSSMMGSSSPNSKACGGGGGGGSGGGSSGKKGSRSKGSSSGVPSAAESATERAKKVFGDVQESLKISVKKLEEQDHPAAHLIDTVCGPYFDHQGGGSRHHNRKMRENRSASFYSEDIDSDDSRTISEDEQTLDTDYNASTVNGSTVASSSAAPISKSKKDSHGIQSSMDSSYLSQSDYESEVGAGGRSRRKNKRDKRRGGGGGGDDPSMNSDDEDDSKHTMDNSIGTNQGPTTQLLSKPLASSFAKRCYFTKAGIGKTTQHYEGLTLTGNVVLMLAAAMKLKGCPTICDEDLRRVEQTYPNQFSRLPDELLLSSGWRRISKYCHFSNKPIPDGIPFFHSKQRLHPQGGYYFLLAAAVGMVRPIDVEPLTRDTLVLLETDYPTQCDAAPEILIQDPDEWTLVDKFCFFSGGPINTEEDVYYQADFDGNPIYMLAFLSPSLTPEELYKLEGESEDEQGNPIPGLTSVAAVQEVESVYDLTERDFHDLKLYHLGPCRALPQYILQPQAWTKVLPPHFLEARHRAILRAQEYELANGGPVTPLPPRDPMEAPAQQLTVGATPADAARYGESYPPGQPMQQPPYDEPPPHHHHEHHPPLHPPHQHPHYPPGGPMGPPQEDNNNNNNGYYMSPRQLQQQQQQQGGDLVGQQQGFSSEYETMGAHNNGNNPMADAYHHHHHHHHHPPPPAPGQPPHLQQHQQHPHNPHQPLPPQHYHQDPQQQQQPSPTQQQQHSSPYKNMSSPRNPSPHSTTNHSAPSPHNNNHAPSPHSTNRSPRNLSSPRGSQQGSQQPQQQQQHQLDPTYQEDEKSRQSANFQREVEEEGAFGGDTHTAPLDETIAARKAGPPGASQIGHHQGMDPPEHLPPDPEVEESVAASEPPPMSPHHANNVSGTSGSYYSNSHAPPNALEISKDESQYSNEMGSPGRSPGRGDAPSYHGGEDAAPQYSYSASPDKSNHGYYHEDQSRDDQYYDSPENHQDHEFFNAPSGGGEDEEDYEPSNVSSFDPHGHIGRHPDDHQYSTAGYSYDDDEADSRLEIQESSSAEYFRSAQDASPSPIKVDHLRQLGRNNHHQQQQSPSPRRGGSAMASPMSQASSQNSVSEYSHTSAMRGAQELLKRNRQRRHEQARRRLGQNAEVRVNNSMDTDGSPVKSSTQYAFAPDQHYHGGASQQRGGDDGSASTWESNNSEPLSSVISGSSVWTDSSSNPADRSSRRALILQMAKARMKSNKERDPAEKTIKEEKSGSVDGSHLDDYGDDHSDLRPNGLTEVTTAATTDLDFAADLD